MCWIYVLPGRYTQKGILKAMVMLDGSSRGVWNRVGPSGAQPTCGVRGLTVGRHAAFPPSTHG